LDDFVAPWPALVKRVRFLSSLKQADLAEALDVDQTSVSRWERGLTVPDFPVQKRLRDMLRELEPTISRSFIEHAPGLVALGRIETVGFCVAVSEAGAAQFQLIPAEMRDRWMYDVQLENERALYEAIDATEGWRHGEMSMLNAECSVKGMLAQYKFSPIGGTGLFMALAAIVPPPKGFTNKDFELAFKSYDELCD